MTRQTKHDSSIYIKASGISGKKKKKNTKNKDEYFISIDDEEISLKNLHANTIASKYIKKKSIRKMARSKTAVRNFDTFKSVKITCRVCTV